MLIDSLPPLQVLDFGVSEDSSSCPRAPLPPPPRWLLIASLVIGAGAALVFSLLETQIYTGTASISFQDINQQATLVAGSAAQTLETPAELAAKSSRIVNQVSVLRAAVTASGSRRTVADLNGDTSAVVDPATNLVTVSVDDHTGSGAARLATAVASAAVNAANDQARQQFRADAHALAHEIRLIPNDAANAVTRQNEQANLSRLQSLSVLARPASINQTASVPGGPSSPKTPFNTLIGAVLGLMVGFGIAFAREATDRQVQSRKRSRASSDCPSSPRSRRAPWVVCHTSRPNATKASKWPWRRRQRLDLDAARRCVLLQRCRGRRAVRRAAPSPRAAGRLGLPNA